MKILMISPNFHSGGPENIVGTLPPLGLLYIGSSLIKGGYEDLELRDLSKEEKQFTNDAEMIDSILASQPSIIFIGGMASTASLPRSLAISKAIKESDDEVKIVLGGVHPTYMYDDIMKNFSFVDFIVRGEGELTSSELVRALDNDSGLESIKNLVWRDDTVTKANEISHEIVNMNDYSPAWSLITNWDYYRSPINNEISAVIQFSRGCNHRCNFCGQQIFWKRWHSRSIESLTE